MFPKMQFSMARVKSYTYFPNYKFGFMPSYRIYLAAKQQTISIHNISSMPIVLHNFKVVFESSAIVMQNSIKNNNCHLRVNPTSPTWI